MISLDKKYKTRSGLKVQLHNIKIHNSAGREVTYPVKGTIYMPPKQGGVRERKRYFIWSIDGKADVVWNKPDLDLIEV